MFNKPTAWSGLRPSPQADYLPRYQQLRAAGIPLNTRLVKSLPKHVIDEGGKKLGMLKKKVLTLTTEDEIAVLMDCCLHDLRWEGRTAVEHFLAESPPPDGSDEMILLQALLQARFTLIAVEAVTPGVGVHVEDLMLGDRLFLMDVGFSQSARLGMVLAARLFAPDGVYRTTGAALPVGMMLEDKRAALLHTLRARFPDGDYRRATPELRSEFTFQMVRSCIERGASDHIVYGEVGEGGLPEGRKMARAGERSAVKLGRNDPCACGSGRKFKSCCLRRR